MKNFVHLFQTLVFLAATQPCFAQCLEDPSLLGWWTGNGATTDAIGGHDGVLFGDATYAPGLVNQAFSFDGFGDYVQLPAAIAQGTPADITISAWIYPAGNKQSVVYSAYTVLLRGNDLEDGWGAHLWRSTTHHMFFEVVVNHVAFGVYFPEPLALHQWHHVVGVRRGTEIEIWVNGRMNSGFCAQGPLRGAGRSYIGWTGYDPFAFWGDNFYNDGRIDEVTVFNRALAPDEIQALFDCTIQISIESLAETVLALNLQSNIENSLDAKLGAAIQALSDVQEQNDPAALNSLYAFIKAVEAQRGKKISSADADTLISAAHNIISALGLH
jgi:hypothetical protein